MTRRWLFADQIGPHFLDDPDQRVLLIESRAVLRRRVDGAAPLANVEGFIRQIIGWRDYVWNIYWHVGQDYHGRNALSAARPLPGWFTELDADAYRLGVCPTYWPVFVTGAGRTTFRG